MTIMNDGKRVRVITKMQGLRFYEDPNSLLLDKTSNENDWMDKYIYKIFLMLI